MKQTIHIFIRAIIVMMLLLVVGCDGFNSPTGPTDPYQRP